MSALTDAQNRAVAGLESTMMINMTFTVSYLNTSFQFTYGSGSWNFFKDYIMAFPNGTFFPANFEIPDVNGVMTAMTWSEALTLIQNFMNLGLAVWQHYQAKVASVMAATTPAQALSVSW